jgi:hypothetical protein
MEREAATAPVLRTCPLCGGGIPADTDSCPSGCPMAKKCNLICCPNCGYEFVEESAVVSGLSRLWKRIRRST